MKKSIIACTITALLSCTTAFASSQLDKVNEIASSEKYYIKFILTRDHDEKHVGNSNDAYSDKHLERKEIIIARNGKKFLVTTDYFGPKNFGSIALGMITRTIDVTAPTLRFTTILDDCDSYSFKYDIDDARFEGDITYHPGVQGSTYGPCEMRSNYTLYHFDFFSKVLDMYPPNQFTENIFKSYYGYASAKSFCNVFTGSGQETVDGETYDYEQYECKDGNIPESRKYYFKDGKLVKVVTTDGPGRIGARKTVGHNATLRILEFTDNFDDSIFNIPQGLQIKEDPHWRKEILKRQELEAKAWEKYNKKQQKKENKS